ncbi:MAG: hypothetical protein J6R04_08230 [Clostridia bacterium]|nr:hypothetical protein [Clostridia bacterium]
MKTNLLRVMAIALVIGMLLATGCSLLSGEDHVTRLVQGNLDQVYLGEYDEEYLSLVDLTAEEAEEEYQTGLRYEAEYFAYYFGILTEDESFDDLSPTLQQDIIDLYDEIYSHSSYEVEPSVRQRDGSYTVKVRIKPIDIMVQVVELYENDGYQPLLDYFSESGEIDWSTITEEEYWADTNRYGELMVDMVRSLLPGLGYGEEKSQVIQVDETEDGYLQINGDDFAIFDEYVITYP